MPSRSALAFLFLLIAPALCRADFVALPAEGASDVLSTGTGTPTASDFLVPTVGDFVDGTDPRLNGTGSVDRRRSGFVFDLSALPAGATITSATLRLTTRSGQAIIPSPVELFVGGVSLAAPSLTLADFSAPEPFASILGPIPDSFPADDPTHFALDVTDLARLFGPYIGFILTAGDGVVTYGVGEPAGLAPELDVTFSTVPEPASLGMVALGVVGGFFAGVRGRSRHARHARGGSPGRNGTSVPRNKPC